MAFIEEHALSHAKLLQDSFDFPRIVPENLNLFAGCMVGFYCFNHHWKDAQKQPHDFYPRHDIRVRIDRRGGRNIVDEKEPPG